MKSIIVRLLTVAMACSLFAPIANASAAPESPPETTADSSALVVGAYRIEVRQTVIDADAADLGLTPDGEEVLVVAVSDVTNLGAPAPFDAGILSIGTVTGSPLEMTNGVTGETAATTSASTALGLSSDGTLVVAENSTIRVAVVFRATNDISNDHLIMRVGDQVTDISATVTDRLNIPSLPAVIPTMALRIADITGTPGDGTITVAFRDGGSEDIRLSGVQTPAEGADSRPRAVGTIPGCFYAESSAAIMAMSNGTVWLEEDAATGDYLAWINNPSMGIFDLMNGRLVQEGFAGINEDDTSSPYYSWLASAQEYVYGQGLGLWENCRTASGIWVTIPTPAPEPTKTAEELRAEYQWIDARDLVIRPGNFQGQKIAVAGTVFNIQVDGPITALQIWLSGGNYDAAVVIYIGDTQGIYEGTWVTAYGKGDGTFTGTNAFGGTIVQPVIRADILDW